MFRNDLLDRYRHLASDTNPQQRGYALETLVSELFAAAHFKVTKSSRMARPRQTDLVATIDHDAYLIETKWNARPAGVPEVDEVRTRLAETPSGVIGVLVSATGFTKTARERVVAFRSRPILLIEGVELERLLQSPVSLREHLVGQHEALVVHGVTTRNQQAVRRSAVYELPRPDVQVVELSGQLALPVLADGGFDDTLMVDELPDVDWVVGGGRGVTADFRARVDNAAELASLLEALTAQGWTSPQGRWVIRQAHVNWNGVGCASLIEAIVEATARYALLDDAHHTEEVAYFDVVEHGFYTLSADIDVSDLREVGYCNLSMHCIGVPLDASPLRNLATACGSGDSVYFRPMTESSVTRHRVLREERQDLEPLKLILSQEHVLGRDPISSPTVCGVVVRNPFYKADEVPAWWPGHATESEVVVCALRSWHPLDEPRSAYHLWMVESARTADAFVMRVVVDWDWKDAPLGRPPWQKPGGGAC